MNASLTRRHFLGGTVAALSLPGVRLAFADTAPHFGPLPGVAKLNANENPYGPSEKAIQAMILASSKGAYYVGETVPRLIDMIAERHGLSAESVSLSSGSSGVLTYLAVAMSRQGKILGPDLYWDTTTKAALRQGGEMMRTPKTADLGIDLDALYDAITPDVSMVQICNPNNPTGMLLDAEKLRAFCIKASSKCAVLIDEAYNEITDLPEENSMAPLVKQGYNVYVARTFSKIYGLAGMRVGYMLATPDNTRVVQQYGLGNYALNQAGVAAAVASYHDDKFLNYSKTRILEAREMITDALSANGIAYAPTQTSFVYADLGSLNAETFRQEMAEEGVLIRGVYQDYTHWSRVSTGLVEDVARYVTALPKVLNRMNA